MSFWATFASAVARFNAGMPADHPHTLPDAFLSERFAEHEACRACPASTSVAQWFGEVFGLLVPERAERRYQSVDELREHAAALQARLRRLVEVVREDCPERPDAVAERFMATLPVLHAHIAADVDAIERGDPAAVSRAEVARTYPGVLAIAAYRVAHALHVLDVPLVPRIISAYAHGATGIDIHPAARIGRSFCIDHGTGVVIGATTVIGDRVKLYQGVTLGGLSVRKADADVKRHPTIEDDVVIYAGATILGGQTVIGRGSVIGGNVWLTRSVPPGTRVTYRVVEGRDGAAGEVVTVMGAA